MHSTSGTTLLETLRDSRGDESRADFDERYRPVLYGFGRRVGLSEEQLPDAVQDALEAFVSELCEGRFDGHDGSRREWLFESAAPRITEASLTAQDVLSSPAELRRVWNAEWRRAIVRRALDELYRDENENSHVLQAFELHCLEHRQADDVAHELGMSRSAVFSAKTRLMERLSARVLELESEF